MRRALVLAAAAALGAPAAALASVQQVLLPGPTPYPTPSPPLVTVAAPPTATLPFRIHASSDQHVVAGVDPDGRIVSLRALHRLLLERHGRLSDRRQRAGRRRQPRAGLRVAAGPAPGPDPLGRLLVEEEAALGRRDPAARPRRSVPAAAARGSTWTATATRSRSRTPRSPRSFRSPAPPRPPSSRGCSTSRAATRSRAGSSPLPTSRSTASSPHGASGRRSRRRFASRASSASPRLRPR